MMGTLERMDFDKYISLSEQTARKSLIASNDAFTLAMEKAASRGREKVRPGTFVENSPAIGALRIRGDVILSSCGSPAQMCMEQGGSQIGAEAMK